MFHVEFLFNLRPHCIINYYFFFTENIIIISSVWCIIPNSRLYEFVIKLYGQGSKEYCKIILI